MKCYISAVCALSVLVALTCAAPMPQSNQVIDNVIQNVTSTAFRVIGRVLLQSGGLGGGGGGGGDSRVSVVLPTFAPDDYEDEEDEEEEDNSIGSSSSTEASSTTTSSTVTSSEQDDLIDVRVNDIRVPIDSAPSPASDSSRTKRDLVRTIRAAEDEDQEPAASGATAPTHQTTSPTSKPMTPTETRDICPSEVVLVRRDMLEAVQETFYSISSGTADGAARAAGTVYRMIAGTENFGLGLTATATSSRTLPAQLIAGSGATEESDEKDNAPGAGGVAEIDVAKGGDGYTEGIPGPITRLFVLANRGLANLVQDLILRLAQTSERIVNFKARLITALI